MVVGQSIPQQYPQSPAQTVPPTQVRNYVVILGTFLPSLRPSLSLRPWLLAEYTTTVSSVSSTDSASHSGKKLCCYTRDIPSQPQAQPQPQTMVVGQSIDHGCWAPQQYPQSPAQTVPPTQVRNYVVILGTFLPSLRPSLSLRLWLLGKVYHSSILSLQHRQCLPLR